MSHKPIVKSKQEEKRKVADTGFHNFKIRKFSSRLSEKEEVKKETRSAEPCL
jgi:hypothetical protein